MMAFRVRQCCCALHTFVRLVCLFLLLAHLLTALLACIWHWMATSDEARRGDGDRLKSDRLAAAVLGVVLLFSAVGVAVNALALLGVRRNRRTLMIPWLVFQLLVIIGEMDTKWFNYFVLLRMLF